ncbi:hypothetical protein F5887DRAFT_952421 [Amanita rubescens]|nr:hypothetical protein F5887DRAFT_952421 [Amanita rubescens]
MNLPITHVARSFFSTNSILRGSAKMPKFFVYAPDAVDPNTLDKRYDVRARHFEVITPLIESGVVLVDGRNKAIGSALIVQAENIEEVRKIIENDIYVQSGVWDKEKLLIAPFIPATPFPA